MLYRLPTLVLLSLAFLCPDALYGQTQAKDPMEEFPKVVALVNGKTISREYLAQECLKRYGSLVLDNLLNKHLILQACQAKGIQITQKDVNDEIARISSKVGLSPELFLRAIEDERDISPEQYASEIVWPMLALRQLAADKIQVADDEVDKMIHSKYGPKVQVRMIALRQADKAQQVHAKVTAEPATFRKMAIQHSEDPASASVEGLLPPIRRYSGDDQLERIAFQLQPDQISPVFQIGDMNIILQCVRHLPAEYPSAELLPTIRQREQEQLRDQLVGQAADEIFSTLQKNAQVVTVLGNTELEKKYAGVAAYINRQPVPLSHLSAECVKRHGKEILRGEINRFLLTDALKQSGKQVTQPDIDAEIADAAERAGYFRDGKPDVTGWLESILQEDGATIELYVADAVWPSIALRKLVEDGVEITQEDLQKGFDANFGPRAEVLAIVLSNQRTAQDVFGKAQRSLTEQSFGELAAKYSVEPVSRSNFGKIPAIRRNTGNPTLEKAAFALKPGEISGVLAWGEQFAILYKQGETSPIVNEISAVQEELTREIRSKKLNVAMRSYLDKMLKNSQIDNWLEKTTQAGSVQPASASTSGKTQVVAPAGGRR